MTGERNLTTLERDHVRRLIGELAPEPTGPPGPNARLVEDLDYHSLALAELAIAIAEAFGLDIEDKATFGGLPEAGTVQALEDLILRAIGQQAR
jgi:acyl carrier protein